MMVLHPMTGFRIRHIQDTLIDVAVVDTDHAGTVQTRLAARHLNLQASPTGRPPPPPP
ncbi:MAG TPA: hypothetical protein VGO93_25505 [Candidatus Xenobia bacterium]